ncbi:MAG TPA: S26 family signal peptidase, partial [Tepidisphaeraceae bacterium]|nr:S26 family signal peptidase [Tepidisphaeraceae bacterium]
MPDTAPPPTPHAKSETNIKETIESILIAFILAFIFRAFIVEAFVIPTGSMATTLLGAHMRYDCADCGYHFTVNYSGDQIDGDVQIPSFARVAVRDRNGVFTGQVVNQVFAIHCPNCGYRVPRTNPDNPDADATAPPVHFGDRILVLKYLYLMQHPARWDVVVFKNPDSPVRDHTQNYIKRLIVLPGESIMILD